MQWVIFLVYQSLGGGKTVTLAAAACFSVTELLMSCSFIKLLHQPCCSSGLYLNTWSRSDEKSIYNPGVLLCPGLSCNKLNRTEETSVILIFTVHFVLLSFYINICVNCLIKFCLFIFYIPVFYFYFYSYLFVCAVNLRTKCVLHCFFKLWK